MERDNNRAIEISPDVIVRSHEQLLIDAASAIDHHATRHEIEAGVVIFDAMWSDEEGYRYYLTSQMRKKADLDDEDMEMRADYFVRRESSMPGTPMVKYHFSTGSTEVRLVHENGERQTNSSLEENQYNTLVVQEYLSKREGQTPIDVRIMALELEYYMADEHVRQQLVGIAQMGEHSRRRKKNTEMLVKYIMKDEPLFSQSVLARRLEQERHRLRGEK